MANNFKIPAAVANLMLDAGIGVPADSGKLRIYDGTQPTDGGGALSGQNLLVEFPMGADAFPPASSGLLSANAIGSGTSGHSGTPAWFRLLKSDGTTVLSDGSVGASGCDLNGSTTIVSGNVYAVSSLTINHPLA
jgi:hypothetical protein